MRTPMTATRASLSLRRRSSMVLARGPSGEVREGPERPGRVRSGSRSEHRGGGGDQVIADGFHALVGGTGPLLVPAVAGAQEDGARAAGVAHLDVAPVIADDPRARQIEAMVRGG